ncbi:hypothetical protein PENSTE_c019G09469 [Penicillium steckii]|uniref:Uncharacterized protein n=1 Tax=Penicillium steckii TaxID=303698 RepID=A0A1V6SUZ8_9EURO|nr:hypothetical protein PENSTE_c019G09469 [Penicillium steckii]
MNPIFSPPHANFYVQASARSPNPSATDDEVGIDLSLRPFSKLLKQDEDTAEKLFDTEKPTCSINLICQRNGFLQKYQIHVINKDRCATPDQFDSLITNVKGLIKTDSQFFKTVKRTYDKKLRGIWRRLFSLKELREIRLVSFTPLDHRPVPVYIPQYTKHDILFAYRHPEKLHSTDEWIQWIYKLRQPNQRYALEFIETWSTLRIMIAVSTLLLLSTSVGVIWSILKDDIQTAFTIASFVLAAGTVLLAALGIVNSIDSSTSDESIRNQPPQNIPPDQDQAKETAVSIPQPLIQPRQ